MFAEQKITIQEAVDARKIKLGEEQTWDLLKKNSEIIVGHGKKYSVYIPTESNKIEILKACLGRSGNLRAPALKIGNRFIIGFNEEMYREFVA